MSFVQLVGGLPTIQEDSEVKYWPRCAPLMSETGKKAICVYLPVSILIAATRKAAPTTKQIVHPTSRTPRLRDLVNPKRSPLDANISPATATSAASSGPWSSFGPSQNRIPKAKKRMTVKILNTRDRLRPSRYRWYTVSIMMRFLIAMSTPSSVYLFGQVIPPGDRVHALDDTCACWGD